MSKKFSIINIGNITHSFHKSIEEYHGLFYVTPIVSGLLSPILLKGDNEQVATVFNAFLASFVPLFATILTFYMSWCYNKMDTRRNDTRLRLFRQTSTCILLMIPIAAFALVIYAVSLFKCGSCVLQMASIVGLDLPEFMDKVTLNCLWRYVLLSAYYGAIAEILLILLMVCKRAHAIIVQEIQFLINQNQEEEAVNYEREYRETETKD